MASFSQLRSDVFSREHRRQHHGSHIMGLNAYDRHRKFMNDYAYGEWRIRVVGNQDNLNKDADSRRWISLSHYGRVDTSETSDARKLVKTDLDTLRETYRFIRTAEDDEDGKWEQRLAKRYYDKLFREYCIADMSRYKDSKIGLRWRSEKEVIRGKGMKTHTMNASEEKCKLCQFICGNKSCDETDGLNSYEVNFAYKESGENRQALVKLRVCPGCAYKLNYRKEKKLARKKAKEERRLRKRKRRKKEDGKRSLRSDSASETGDESDPESESDSDSDEKNNANGETSKGPTSPPPVGRDGKSQLQSSQVTAENKKFDDFFEGMFL